MGFRKDFRELISFFSNRPKGYIPDQESVGGDRVKIGGISNRGSETIENSGVNKSDSLHLLHNMGFRKEFRELFSFSPTDRKDTSPVRNQLEKIEQKLEEILTEALEPLKLLESTKTILFTRSIKRASETSPEAL